MLTATLRPQFTRALARVDGAIFTTLPLRQIPALHFTCAPQTGVMFIPLLVLPGVKFDDRVWRCWHFSGGSLNGQYLGELAALGTATMWAFSSIAFTLGGQRVGSVIVNRARLVLAVLFLGAAHWLLIGRPFPWDADAAALPLAVRLRVHRAGDRR